MKWIIFMCLMTLSISSFAQQFSKENPGTPEQRAQMMTDTMKTSLSLTEDQVPEIYDLNLKYAEIMQKEVIDTDKNMISKYWKGNEIMKQKEAELKPLLTEEQWKGYLSYKDAIKGKMLKRLF